MTQTHLVLRRYFERKKGLPGYSLRALAGRLKMSASFLSRVLSGKKSIPFALLLKLQRALDIEPEVFSLLKEAHSIREAPGIRLRGRAKVQSALKDWNLVSSQQLASLNQWYYLAILEMTTLSNFDGNPETIARRLKISQPVAELALRELERQGLVEYQDGMLKKSQVKLRWGSARSLREIREFHRQLLVKAQQELIQSTSDSDFARRLISGITLSVAPDKIEWAKQRLNECLHEIANQLSDDPGSEVYHLAVQFFPLTKE